MKKIFFVILMKAFDLQNDCIYGKLFKWIMEQTLNTLKSCELLLTRILINLKEARKLFRAPQSEYSMVLLAGDTDDN